MEWTSPINQVVDNFACYKRKPGVKDCLGYVPGRRLYRSIKSEAGHDLGEMMGSRQLSAEQIAEAHRAYRFDIARICYLATTKCDNTRNLPTYYNIQAHYRVVHKIWHTFVRILTSSNTDQLSIFFRCQNQEKICNYTISKNPTTQHSTMNI